MPFAVADGAVGPALEQGDADGHGLPGEDFVLGVTGQGLKLESEGGLGGGGVTEAYEEAERERTAERRAEKTINHGMNGRDELKKSGSG